MRYTEDELYHWGIKGQKWGFRRFQNKDGSLTPAGRERYGVGNRTGESVVKSVLASTSSPKKKSVSDYSDEELASMIRRKQQEKQLQDLLDAEERRVAAMVPKSAAEMTDYEKRIAKLQQEKTLRELEAAAHPGRTMVKTALLKAGDKAISTMGGGALLFVGSSIVKSAFDNPELAYAIGTGGIKKDDKKDDKDDKDDKKDDKDDKKES